MSGEWTVPGYRHIRPLGTGAAGEVVLAVHRPTDTPVTIKVLSADLLRDEAFVDRFRKESQLLSELDDPGVVRVYEMIESAAEPMGPPRRGAVVTELVDGVSLAQLLNADGPVGPEAALLVLKRMLPGLGMMHGCGVVHRDIKPANVLVGGDGSPKLSDFGLAVRESEHAPAPGSPAYFAPELWDGLPATPRTDLYAATATFYECITGESPYPSLSLLQLALAHRSAQIPVQGVPQQLRPLVVQGLAKSTTERVESASALLGLLEAVAVAAYGFDWEERGRAELAERAGVLHLLFPLSRPIEPEPTPSHQDLAHLDDPDDAALADDHEDPGHGDHHDGPGRPAGTKDRRGNRRRLSGGVVLAALATMAVLLGGTGAAVYAANAGHSVFDKETVPTEKTDGEIAAGPSPGPRGGDYSSGPLTKTGRTPPGPPTASPTVKDRSLPRPSTRLSSPGPTPTGPTDESGSPSTPANGVSDLSVNWYRSTSRAGAGTVTVNATGTGPITLTIAYFDNGEPAGSQTIELRGSWSYNRQLNHSANHRCIPMSVTVSTSPASPGGPQSRSFGVEPGCWWQS